MKTNLKEFFLHSENYVAQHKHNLAFQKKVILLCWKIYFCYKFVFGYKSV